MKGIKKEKNKSDPLERFYAPKHEKHFIHAEEVFLEKPVIKISFKDLFKVKKSKK